MLKELSKATRNEWSDGQTNATPSKRDAPCQRVAGLKS